MSESDDGDEFHDAASVASDAEQADQPADATPVLGDSAVEQADPAEGAEEKESETKTIKDPAEAINKLAQVQAEREAKQAASSSGGGGGWGSWGGWLRDTVNTVGESVASVLLEDMEESARVAKEQEASQPAHPGGQAMQQQPDRDAAAQGTAQAPADAGGAGEDVLNVVEAAADRVASVLSDGVNLVQSEHTREAAKRAVSSWADFAVTGLESLGQKALDVLTEEEGGRRRPNRFLVPTLDVDEDDDAAGNATASAASATTASAAAAAVSAAATTGSAGNTDNSSDRDDEDVDEVIQAEPKPAPVDEVIQAEAKPAPAAATPTPLPPAAVEEPRELPASIQDALDFLSCPSFAKKLDRASASALLKVASLQRSLPADKTAVWSAGSQELAVLFDEDSFDEQLDDAAVEAARADATVGELMQAFHTAVPMPEGEVSVREATLDAVRRATIWYLARCAGTAVQQLCAQAETLSNAAVKSTPAVAADAQDAADKEAEAQQHQQSGKKKKRKNKKSKAHTQTEDKGGAAAEEDSGASGFAGAVRSASVLRQFVQLVMHEMRHVAETSSRGGSGIEASEAELEDHLSAVFYDASHAVSFVQDAFVLMLPMFRVALLREILPASSD